MVELVVNLVVTSLYTFLVLLPISGLFFLAARRERERTRRMLVSARRPQYQRGYK